MNIGIVCYPTFGGSGVVATELGKALALNGHQVHFITYSMPVRLDFFSPNITYHEVSVSSYPLFDYAPYESALASKLVDVARSEKLDILHVHYAIPHASVAWLAKQILATYGINIPVVTTLHGTDITLVGKDLSYEPVVTFAINNSDGITAVSESLKRDTYRNFKIEKEIRVIYNFVDLNRFGKESSMQLKQSLAPGGEKLVVHTSNFRKVKRVEDVVRVFDRVVKSMKAKLILVGDGPERAAIEKLCKEIGNCEHVRFMGKQEAVEDILSCCDLFIMPSESESFGLAALEAMACRIPVISTNTGGMPELNVHGHTGFMSDVGDVVDMAFHAIKLLSDPLMLASFKQNAYEQAKRFSIEAILPQYVDYYNEVLARK
ncbi:MAG: N-acetyl-alpha-D-glucosaminyl L-malate synthase BshA [Bacteroidota bacterium]